MANPKNTAAMKRGWNYNYVDSLLEAYVDGNVFFEFGASDHCNIYTIGQSKTLRLNSRAYTTGSGDWNAVQSKPNVTVGTTASVKAIEVSPRFASGIAGGSMTGIMSNPDLKGSSAGTLSGEIRCYDAKFDGGTGRTVTGPCYSYKAQTANAATITNGCFVIGAQAAGGGGTGWTGFARASASGAGGISTGSMTKDPATDSIAGNIIIYIDSTKYEVPIYATS